jgi:hypothetical protein
MKTSKFEDTIRRKLESIEPDFQEADWAKMQNYMQAHTPPTFWQQYGSWIGYAAAASVTTVMALMYVGQLKQNNNLVADIKNLRDKIEVIEKTPSTIVKSDTVYLVEKIYESEESAFTIANSSRYPRKASEITEATVRNEHRYNRIQPSENQGKENTNIAVSERPTESGVSSVNTVTGYPSNTTRLESGADNRSGQRVINAAFAPLASHNSSVNTNGSLSRKMKYVLANRISPKRVQKILILNPQAQQTLLAANTPQHTKSSMSAKKAEQATQAENVIPRLDIKVPYRFGGSIQTESNGVAKTVLGEVLISKKFSISAGVSWLKVKPMEFFNEKIFREKNRKDFKRSHPGEVPLALDVYNIKINPTLVQIPLTVAFRNTLKDDWAYYAGAGTNITVSAKEKISFDCKTPNREYFSQTFERKSDIPVINSVNLSAGVEKTWYPIVFQAEGYLYTYFKALTPLNQRTGPGVKVKLMYQIGGKM